MKFAIVTLGCKVNQYESQAMERYLLTKGVPKDRILREDQSDNTYQNMQFSKHVIEKNYGAVEEKKISFATTNYHIFRGYTLAKKNGFYCPLHLLSKFSQFQYLLIV